MNDGPNTGEAQERQAPETPATNAGQTTGTVENKEGQGEKEKPASPDEMPWWKEWIELLVRAGFWALLIYLFIFQVSVVEGSSMQHTFEDKDKLVIDKLTYHFSSIRRFDVVVFETVDLDKPINQRHVRDYIKRVIGLPGETITIHNGRIEKEGRPLAENFLPPNERNKTGPEETFVVPEGHYLVMGDNRMGSHDSRSAGMGFVPVGQIKGLVRLRWWPWERAGWISRESSE